MRRGERERKKYVNIGSDEIIFMSFFVLVMTHGVRTGHDLNCCLRQRNDVLKDDIFKCRRTPEIPSLLPSPPPFTSLSLNDNSSDYGLYKF